MREILTRYGRHNIGFLWVFFEPMMFTLGILTLWTIIKATHGTEISIAAFAITGYSSVLLWRNCASRCALAILPNQSLLYHRNVRVIDLFLARILLEVSGATASFITLSIVFCLMGLMAPPADLSLVVLGWIHLAVLGCGMGFTTGALSELSETMERLWHTVAYLLFPISGAVFLVDWLPTKMQSIVLMLPMVHGVELLRAGYFGSAIKSHYDPIYMIVSDLSILLIGLTLVRHVSNKVEPE
jgi:capsular polysaccharide transport system permease protein